MADSAVQRTPPHAEPPARRFSAFISYSHDDDAFARRLHRQLEAYRLPRRLLGKSGEALLPDRRLKPIFRDSDELSASYDLSMAVREAVEHSDHLIVVCSPSAAQSDWVGREIELYRTLHGDERILAVIPPDTGESVFHPALRGWLGGPGLEPMAADFRREGGGRKLALLKLVAALAGVHLDELVQRDAQRQIQRIGIVGAGAVVGIAVVATLAVFGLSARHDAETQRARAGGLNAFMLTDLRKGLQSAGRLDLLTAVNKAALDSYKGQDLSSLPAETLEQRAKALQAAGEDNEKRGDLKTAQAQFEEARRTTAALLAARPNDPQRIFDHAQSEYWVGFVNWRNGDGAAAKAGFEAYAALTGRLVKIDPKNAAWRAETGDAESNLGMLALRQAGDLPTAERHFTTALATAQSVAALNPSDTEAQIDVADGYAWLADTERLQGNFAGAIANRAAQRRYLDKMLAADPRNVEVRLNLLYCDLAVSRIDADHGLFSEAIETLDRGHDAAVALERGDPGNAFVAKERRVFELFKVRTLLGTPAGRRPSPSRLLTMLGDCEPTNNALVDDELRNFCIVLRARVLAELGDPKGVQGALASMHPPAHAEAYSKRWGLNFTDEAKLVHLTETRGRD
jgi:tetratricopeptide (TPR) repeat protein